MKTPFPPRPFLAPRLWCALPRSFVPAALPMWALASAAVSALVPGVARAASRPGAARTLAVGLNVSAGVEGIRAWSTQPRACTLAPNLSWAGAGAAGGPGVFFVREDGAERGVWLATPRPDAPGVSAAQLGDGAWTGRGVRWSTLPLLKILAPVQISTPVPVDGGRLLLLSTNAATLDGALLTAPGPDIDRKRSEKRGRWRVACVDPQAGRWCFLSPPDADCYDPALSPDGRRLAFTSMRGDRESVQTITFARSLGEMMDAGRALEREPWRAGSQHQAAASARGARWIDASTLILESTSTRAARERSALGLYVLPLRVDGTPGEPRLLLPRAREVAVAPNGRSLCAVVSAAESVDGGAPGDSRRVVVSREDVEAPTLLVMMAPDGSGQRWLQDTRGARRPSFVDARALLFDAPVGLPPSRAEGQSGAVLPVARTLWSVPLLRTPPVATLASVAPLKSLPRSVSLGEAAGAVGDDDALAVVGTAFSSEWGPLSARVEVGQGEAPTQWTLLSERTAAAQNEVVARWKPPANARGDWTLRLRVRDAAGDEAQSLLPVTLPLLMPLSPDAIATVVPAAPSAPASTYSPPAVAAAPRPNPSPRSTAARTRVPGGPVSNLPIPALPRAPKTSIIASDHTAIESYIVANGASGAGASGSAAAAPGERVRSAPEDSSPDLEPPPIDRPRKNTRTSPSPPRATFPQVIGDEAKGDAPDGAPPKDDGSAPAPRQSDTAQKGELEITGLPARMKVGQSVDVTVRWVNRSGVAWRAGKNNARLVQRFLDRDSGVRRRWSYDILKSDTPDGASGEQIVTVTPRAAGRYRLVFSVLAADFARFTPPPGQDAEAQRKWPGEVVAASYTVTVSP